MQPPVSGTATPDPKRKRSSGKLVESSSEEEEAEEGEEVEMEQDESNGVKRGLRNGDGRIQNERNGENGDESTETEGEGEGESLGSGKSRLSSSLAQLLIVLLCTDAVSKLREWPATKLRTLRRSELVDLFLALPSTSSSDPDTSSMTKDTLISAITTARKPPSSSLSSNEDDSADASPQPRTSHEASPEDEIRPRRARTSNPSTRVNGKLTKTRRNKHPLTPPLTSGEEDYQVQEEDEMDLTELEEEEETGTSAGMTRRASQIEMPPPALPPAQKRQPRRNRSNGEDVAAPNVIRFGKRMNEIIQEDEEVPVYTSPVAHRTRGHRPPSNPDPSTSSSAPRTIVANAQGSPARPGRAAKQKAVARIKGKARAEDVDEKEDEEMEVEEEEPENLVASSESDGGGQKGHRKSGQGRRRRSSRTTNQVKQVETPPSDADEESGGEEERDEEAVEVELRSHLRAAGKGAKNGKVVRLKKGKKADEDEPELGESDEEDEDMEADYEEEEDGVEEEEQGEQSILCERSCSFTDSRFFFVTQTRTKSTSFMLLQSHC